MTKIIFRPIKFFINEIRDRFFLVRVSYLKSINENAFIVIGVRFECSPYIEIPDYV